MFSPQTTTQTFKLSPLPSLSVIVEDVYCSEPRTWVWVRNLLERYLRKYLKDKVVRKHMGREKGERKWRSEERRRKERKKRKGQRERDNRGRKELYVWRGGEGKNKMLKRKGKGREAFVLLWSQRKVHNYRESNRHLLGRTREEKTLETTLEVIKIQEIGKGQQGWDDILFLLLFRVLTTIWNWVWLKSEKK